MLEKTLLETGVVIRGLEFSFMIVEEDLPYTKRLRPITVGKIIRLRAGNMHDILHNQTLFLQHLQVQPSLHQKAKNICTDYV